MKFFLYCLLIITACLSCKSKTGQNGTDSTSTNKITDESNALIKQFKPIIQGVWVKKDYIEKVIATKSPAEASNLTEGLTTMYINTKIIEGDSLIVNAGWGNHEGSDLPLYFSAGKKPSTIILGKDDLGYEVVNKDTLLTVYYTEKGVITKISYVKALNKQPDDNLGFGMDVMINKGLIAGNYTWIDNAVLHQVSFTEDGKVKGFFDYKSYLINKDINSDVMDNLDEIGFDVYTKHHQHFTFKINGDTLKLYDTHPNADSTELEIGKLKYWLVRKK